MKKHYLILHFMNHKVILKSVVSRNWNDSRFSCLKLQIYFPRLDRYVRDIEFY